MAIIDPPWRLDPLHVIVNVGWSPGGRILAAAYGMPGVASIVMSLTDSHAWTELKNKKIPAPSFVTQIGLPSDTRALAGGDEFPIDDRLGVTGPLIRIDYRGYVEAALRQWAGDVDVLTGEKIYYDYRGDSISAADIPEAPRKGLAIASDKKGTVYVLDPGPGGDGGITKYDNKGHVLWELDGAPLAANYDKTLKQIVATGYPDSFSISYINLDGTLSTTDISGSIYSVSDASRGGKIYGTTAAIVGVSNNGIIGLNRDGSAIFEIPGPPFGEFAYGSPVAYGEDYILTQKIVNSQTFGFTGNAEVGTTTTLETTTAFYLMVFDANSGAEVSQSDWGTSVITSVVYSAGAPPHPPPPPNSLNQSSYGSLSFARSSYFPPRPA